MNREELKEHIRDAVQRQCGYTQHDIGEIVVAAIEEYIGKPVVEA